MYYTNIINVIMKDNCILPNRAVKLISEYSKPITHPEWRYSRPIITTFRLYLIIFSHKKRVYTNILPNIIRTEWFEMYLYIKHNGLDKYCSVFGKDYDDTYNIDGVYDAMIRYED
jgi:hypothetical protein